MSNYSIDMPAETRILLPAFEEMPEYGIVMEFLDKWDLSDFDIWQKVCTNAKFKDLREEIRSCVAILYKYRNSTLERIRGDYRPDKIPVGDCLMLSNNRYQYTASLKRAADLIKRFDADKDYLFERDKTSEIDYTRREECYEYRKYVRVYLTYGMPFEL